MAEFNWDSVVVYDDRKSDFDIIKDIISVNKQEDAFYILDIETLVRQHINWLALMPRVTPHFAVKSNPNQTVIRILAALNGRFDCASKQEIQQVMQAGVTGDRIIFAHPAKCPSHIRYAKKAGVKLLIVDNTIEILKIKAIYPEAKLVIRVAIDGKSSGINLNRKYGCEPTVEVYELIKFMKTEEMYLQGFSFHLGSPCWDPSAFGRGIEICKVLIKTARSMGLQEVNLIDIGGGIPGSDNDVLQEIARSVNISLDGLDPSIEVISEPGRYFVESAFTLAAYIHSKKLTCSEEGIMKRHYYINDGAYGSFIDELLGFMRRLPDILFKAPNDTKYSSVIWGPTCDSTDCIINEILIEDLSIGDWLVWRNMGSYTISNASNFNGFAPTMVFPIIRKNALELMDSIIPISRSRKNLRMINMKVYNLHRSISH